MATLTKAAPTVNGKPVQFVGTAAFNQLYGGLEAVLYSQTALAILKKHPYDMLVFEMADENHFQVRLAGYHLVTEKLDEKTIVFKTRSLKIKTFWLKLDDQGSFYSATFLFPEDY